MKAFLVRTLFVVARLFHEDLEIYDDHDLPKMTALWENYKTSYGKSYESAEEESFRQQIFKENVEFINWHNMEYVLGLHTHTVGLNQFSDWATHEFTDQVLEERPVYTTSSSNFHTTGQEHVISQSHVPSHIDWRERGYVTPVTDQGLCGSCWAFSAIGSLQGQYFKKYGRFAPDLSEQDLVDCSRGYGNKGCKGGWMPYAFQYIKDNGVDTDECYQYEAKNSSCKYDAACVGAHVHVSGYKYKNSSCSYDAACVGAHVSGYKYVRPNGSETSLQYAVANVGPISVAIDANHKSWRKYKSGVFYEPKCNSVSVTHAVLVVGYGTENGEDYWLVKNSWDTTYGDKGYIKMSRNRDNNCGIASYAVYPVL